MRAWIAAVAVVVVFATPAAAQWQTVTNDGVTFAGIAGNEGRLVITVSCTDGGGLVVALNTDGGAAIQAGRINVFWRWDDGAATNQYSFVGDSGSTMASTSPAGGFTTSYSPEIAGLVTKLRTASSVIVGVPGPSGMVLDWFGLVGSSRAINSLSCSASPSGRTASPSAGRTAASMKRAGMSLARSVASSIQGELDTPMNRVLAQMPDDVTPERSRSGEDRTFIYRFADGSRLTLVARPLGDGRGLALYYVDID